MKTKKEILDRHLRNANQTLYVTEPNKLGLMNDARAVYDAIQEYRNNALTEILKQIDAEESKLNEQDANSYIWWNKFSEFIKANF